MKQKTVLLALFAVVVTVAALAAVTDEPLWG